MLTGELKKEVDTIWEIFWTGGITNPLSVIEQLTYLLFIKGLDDKQRQKENDVEQSSENKDLTFDNDNEDIRWKNFIINSDKVSDEKFDVKMYDIVSKKVFPFIKNMNGDKTSTFSKYMDDAIFMIPTPKMLSKIIKKIDKLPSDDKDVQGDLYEYLLSKIATAGTNGQFRTPRHIIRMMVDIVKPTPKDIIVDPACGTSGFLVSTVEYFNDNHSNLFNNSELKKHYNETMFYGNDMDRTMLRIGAMNMMMHGVENANIEYRDSLSELNKESEKYSLILANPPFKGSLDYDSVSADLLKVTKTKKTEILFLSLFLRILKKGGRCASIVPDGVLFGSSKAHKSIRHEIIENHHLHAIISMPSGVFKPYAGVSTAIMLFTKTGDGGTDDVWFYDMKSDGYSLDDKRQKLEDSNIDDIVNRYHNLDNEDDRERTEQSFLVPKAEIIENDYDLSINRYKEIIYDEVVYDEPLVIIGKIKVLEEEILLGIDEIEKIL